jgi:glycerophosphoryl diester phosphodiesterase
VILLDPEARPLIAHRGASGQYPENTMLAFKCALEQGADAIELDVRVTADGAPVVLHDATLDRTTDRRGTVAGLTLDEVRRAVAGAGAGAGERIPTLAEVLEAFPTTPLIVEIKEPAAALATLAVLRRQRAQGRVLLGAFQRASLAPFRGREFSRAATRVQVAWFWSWARVGVARRGDFLAFTIPERSGLLTVADPPFLRAARRLRLPVHVWTVDDPGAAARLRAAGVCGIITDYPERLRVLAPS